MKTYVDREVLLQVKRIYSKDEIIADLHRQLKESNFKIGVLESQVSELEDEIKILKKQNIVNKHDEYLKTILKQSDDLKIRNRENKHRLTTCQQPR